MFINPMNQFGVVPSFIPQLGIGNHFPLPQIGRPVVGGLPVPQVSNPWLSGAGVSPFFNQGIFPGQFVQPQLGFGQIPFR